MDFDVQVRDKVIEYVRDKYGTECVSKIITFGTLSARAVLRDVGRVLEVDLSKVDRFCKAVPKELHITLKKALEESAEFKEMYDNDPDLQRVYDIASRLEGLNRHRSTHACGVVIGNRAIKTFLPEVMINDKELKKKVRTSSYIGPELEELGLLKMDFLGLRNMSVIRDVVNMCPDIPNGGNVPLTDPYVFEDIGTGRTVGVFQLESGGMQNLMRKMFYDVSDRIAVVEKKYGMTGYGDRIRGAKDEETRNKYQNEMTSIGREMFERLIAAISLFRPGPMDYIPQYIEGMTNPETIHYDCPEMEHILKNTYGVMVYQEQVQQVCRDLAGYSLGRADIIRRAMSKKKKEVMDREKEIFKHGNDPDPAKRNPGEDYVPGCVHNGISEEAAGVIWDKMDAFSAYAFNKSHKLNCGLIQ